MLSTLLGCAGPVVQTSEAGPASTPASAVGQAQVPRPSPVAASSPAGLAAPTPGVGVIAQPGGRGGMLDRDALVAHAVSDAAARTGRAADDIRVVQVEPREWSSSALGCEQPGMGYAQVITSGYLIVLDAGGRMLVYHTDHARAELCPR